MSTLDNPHPSIMQTQASLLVESILMQVFQVLMYFIVITFFFFFKHG